MRTFSRGRCLGKKERETLAANCKPGGSPTAYLATASKAVAKASRIDPMKWNKFCLYLPRFYFSTTRPTETGHRLEMVLHNDRRSSYRPGQERQARTAPVFPISSPLGWYSSNQIPLPSFVPSRFCLFLRNFRWLGPRSQGSEQRSELQRLWPTVRDRCCANGALSSCATRLTRTSFLPDVLQGTFMPILSANVFR